MEVSATVNQLNAGFSRSVANNDAAEQELNAFGIGQANRPEVELSPQARILQQNELVNRERQTAIDEQNRERNQNGNQEEEEQEDDATNAFVRVASSEGSAQRQNLSAERAAEIYRSIEGLL